MGGDVGVGVEVGEGVGWGEREGRELTSSLPFVI